MATLCKHEHTRLGEPRPFTGPVAVRPYTHEWAPAHGNVTYTEVCTRCGAERALNVNGAHHEHAPWGPSRTERIEAAKRRLRSTPRPPMHTARHPDGRELTIEVDARTGEIVLSGAEHTAHDVEAACAALPAGWLDAAKRYRTAVLLADPE